MPITVACPGCSSRIKAPDAAAGKRVKCPKCQSPILVPAAADDAGFEYVDDDPAPAPAKRVAANPIPAKSAARPAARPRAVEDNDEDEEAPPRKKRRAEADDEEGGEPPRKRKRRRSLDEDAPRKKGVSLARNLVMGGVLVVLLVVAGLVFYLKFGRPDDTAQAPPTAAAAPPFNPTPVNPGTRGPVTANPQSPVSTSGLPPRSGPAEWKQLDFTLADVRKAIKQSPDEGSTGMTLLYKVGGPKSFLTYHQFRAANGAFIVSLHDASGGEMIDEMMRNLPAAFTDAEREAFSKLFRGLTAAPTKTTDTATAGVYVMKVDQDQKFHTFLVVLSLVANANR